MEQEQTPEGEFLFCNLRVERRGKMWRVVYEEKGSRKVSEWRERVRFWPDLGLFLKYPKAFAFRGMGTIPTEINPKVARNAEVK